MYCSILSRRKAGAQRGVTVPDLVRCDAAKNSQTRLLPSYTAPWQIYLGSPLFAQICVCHMACKDITLAVRYILFRLLVQVSTIVLIQRIKCRQMFFLLYLKELECWHRRNTTQSCMDKVLQTLWCVQFRWRPSRSIQRTQAATLTLCSIASQGFISCEFFLVGKRNPERLICIFPARLR